jgi:putative aldouronate transport system permease protein
MRYSYSAAVDLFSSVIGFILLISANYTSRAFGERTLW